jgi:hypothetical protein
MKSSDQRAESSRRAESVCAPPSRTFAYRQPPAETRMAAAIILQSSPASARAPERFGGAQSQCCGAQHVKSKNPSSNGDPHHSRTSRANVGFHASEKLESAT